MMNHTISFLLATSILFFHGEAFAQAVPPTGEVLEFYQDAIEAGASIPVVPVEKLGGGIINLDGDTGEWGESATWLPQSALLFQGLWTHNSDGIDWMLQNAAALSPTDATKGKAPEADVKPLDAAMMRFAFDKDHLYVAARVADAELVQAPAAAPPQTGDAIGIGIDVRSLSGKGVDAMGGPFTDEWGHMHVRGSYGLVVAAPGADGATRQALLPPYKTIEGARIAARRIEGGYEIEASLPLQSLKDESGRVVDVSRLKSPIGMQCHVFDRDKNMPVLAPDALPPAPSYTWRRDSTRPNPAERNRAGFTWGLAQAKEADGGTEKGTSDKVQISDPQFENGRLWWRILTWQPQGALIANEKQHQFLSMHRGSAFDIITPGLGPSTLHSPLFQRSLSATKPELGIGEMQSREIPALGVKLSWHDVEAKTLAGGTMVLEAKHGSGSARRAYLLSHRGVSEFSTALADDVPTPIQVKGWLEKAYWGWEITPPSATEALKGTIYYGFWPQDTQRGAALSFLMNSPEKPNWSLRLELRAASGDEKSPALWSAEFPLSATSIAFEIPRTAVPAGRYRMTARLQEMKDGAPSLIPTNISPKEIEIAAPAAQPVLAVDAIWKASVSDAPALLKRTRSLGNPGRATYPQLTGVDAMARGVKDLQMFEGRLFTGDGDSQHNRGPSRIWSIRPNAKEAAWRQDFSAPEEGIEKFSIVEFGGEKGIVVPGIDPADGLGQSKEWGNAYFKWAGSEAEREFGWAQKRTLIKAGWTSDLQSWRDRLFAATELGSGGSKIQFSDDFGQTWKFLEAQNGTAAPTFNFSWLVPTQNYLTGVSWDASEGLLLWDGKAWLRRSPDLLAGSKTNYVINHPSPFALPDAPDAFLYSFSYGSPARPLMVLTSPDAPSAQTVEAFKDAQVRDIWTRDGQAFILSAERRENEDPEAPLIYDAAIYSSKDLKSWTRHAVFQSSALPNALEWDGTHFYVGLSSSNHDERDAAAGEVLILEP